jgi:hypothetical protein
MEEHPQTRKQKQKPIANKQAPTRGKSVAGELTESDLGKVSGGDNVQKKHVAN